MRDNIAELQEQVAELQDQLHGLHATAGKLQLAIRGLCDANGTLAEILVNFEARLSSLEEQHQ
jgi:prefoldin subunit 5